MNKLSEIVVRPGATEHGVGLICVKRVPANTKICNCEAKHCKIVPLDRIKNLPIGVRQTIHDLFDGLHTVHGRQFCQIPTDYDQSIPLVAFINHSLTPTCYFDDGDWCIRSRRILKRGEEATVNYCMYQEPESYTYKYAAANFKRRPL
mgnify:CR=1 FL=1